MDYKIYVAVAVVLVALLMFSLKETFESYKPESADNWIRLYETFTFAPSPPDSRWWEFTTDKKAYLKKDLKMQLKSYDIKVRKGRVQLWAVYPGETLASSNALGVSGYGNAYTDAMPLLADKDPKIMIDGLEYNPPGWQHTYTTNAFKANNAKYQLIADARDGDRLKGTLDFKCTRVMVIANFS